MTIGTDLSVKDLNIKGFKVRLNIWDFAGEERYRVLFPSFVKNADKKLSVDLINKIHKLCFKGTKDFAGKIRKVDVVIRNAKKEIVHVGARPSEVKKLLEKLCNWYEKNKNKFPPLFLLGKKYESPQGVLYPWRLSY